MAVLTTSVIVSGITSGIKSLLEGAFVVIKILALVGFGILFATAIIALIGLFSSFVSTSIIGEVFAIISLCLPFDASVVFSGLVVGMEGIITFLIARKIYELTSDLIGKTN